MYSENASIHGPHSRAFALCSSPSAYSPAQYSDRSRDEHSCLFLTAVSPCASASCHMYTVPATRNSQVCYNGPDPRCTWYTYSPFSMFPNQALPLAKTSPYTLYSSLPLWNTTCILRDRTFPRIAWPVL